MNMTEINQQARYTLRQVNVQKSNLLQVCRLAVKTLIDKSCFETIDETCEELINFCAILEQCLSHRLRPRQTWYGITEVKHFWDYIRIGCRKVPHNCLTSIENLENVTTPRGKGRAWLRVALMEKRLSEYLCIALRQTKLTRQFYLEGAIMMSDQSSMLTGVLLGLNAIDFSFDLKGEKLEIGTNYVIDYTPYLKFNQSPASVSCDQQELRELSHSSSTSSLDLLEEDGEEADQEEHWRGRHLQLEKKFKRVSEQKGYLEELVRLRESQLEEVHKQRQKLVETLQHYEAEGRRERQQLEGVIIELQAQICNLKEDQHDQQRRFEMYIMSQRPPPQVHAPDIQMREMVTLSLSERPQESDGQSVCSSEIGLQRISGSRSVAPPDSKSLLSAASLISGTSQGHCSHMMAQPDSQSLIPMAGSFTSQSSMRSANEMAQQQAAAELLQAKMPSNQSESKAQFDVVVEAPSCALEAEAPTLNLALDLSTLENNKAKSAEGSHMTDIDQSESTERLPGVGMTSEDAAAVGKDVEDVDQSQDSQSSPRSQGADSSDFEKIDANGNSSQNDSNGNSSDSSDSNGDFEKLEMPEGEVMDRSGEVMVVSDEFKVTSDEEVKSIEDVKVTSEEEVKSVEEVKVTSEEEVKSVKEVKATSEEEVKSVDVVKVTSEEEVKSVDEVKVTSEEEVKSVDEVKVTSEEEVKSVDEVKVTSEEEVKSVDEVKVTSEEEVKSVDEVKVTLEEEVKSVDEVKVASEKSEEEVIISEEEVKVTSKEEVNDKTEDGVKVMSQEEVKVTPGEEVNITSDEDLLDNPEEETKVTPEEEVKVTLEEEIAAAEGGREKDEKEGTRGQLQEKEVEQEVASDACVGLKEGEEGNAVKDN